MDATIKRAIERAIAPATQEIDDKIAMRYYASDYPDAETIDDLPKRERVRLVANRAVTIAMLRRGRTYDDATQRDAYDYAKTLVS